MERLYFSNKLLLIYILLFSFFDVGFLRADSSDSNLLQMRAISQLHPFGLSEKNVELITSRPDVDFAYIPEKLVRKSHCKNKCHRGPVGPQGIPGSTGPQGPVGSTGAVGPTGATGGEAGIVNFSVGMGVVRNYDFAFFYSNDEYDTPGVFNYTTSIGRNDDHYASFLVPFDGSISNLVMRFDFSVNSTTETPTFIFTVYGSSSTIGTLGPISGWTSTGLAVSTGVMAVNTIDSPYSGVFQNFVDSFPVTAGTILTIVISSTNYSDFNFQPAYFAGSFKYTPNP